MSMMQMSLQDRIKYAKQQVKKKSSERKNEDDNKGRIADHEQRPDDKTGPDLSDR